MTMAQFFYKVHKKRLLKTNAFRNNYLKDNNLELQTRNPILIPRGRNVQPSYPPSFEYAKATLMMHYPWSSKNPLDFSDKAKVIAQFEQCIERKILPTSVIAQYKRTMLYQKRANIEVVANKTVPLDYD
jgi:hypothetical protein